MQLVDGLKHCLQRSGATRGGPVVAGKAETAGPVELLRAHQERGCGDRHFWESVMKMTQRALHFH